MTGPEKVIAWTAYVLAGNRWPSERDYLELLSSQCRDVNLPLLATYPGTWRRE